MSAAYIVNAVRTPVAKANGAFGHVRPDDLLIHVLKHVLPEQITPDLVEDVVLGCAMPEGEQGLNVARIATLLAGYPDTVPAYTLNRFCASGLQSVANAAQMITSGQSDCVVAAGMESMTMIPGTGFHPSYNPKVFADEQYGIAYGMGLTAEEVAKRWNVSREAQDQFSLRSHQRALAAQEQGMFDTEIVPFEVHSTHINDQQALQTDSEIISQDTGPRADTAIEVLAKLRPVFAANGSVTAGNASQMSDGAGAVLVVSEAFLKQHELQPMARFVGYQVTGVEPEIMGVGPINAIPKVLKKNGIQQHELGHIELNEAFAAQSLAIVNTLELDDSLVNPYGSGISLGHPLGATGAIRTATVVHKMQRDKDYRYAMVTMCIGTGMGAAGIFERV